MAASSYVQNKNEFFQEDADYHQDCIATVQY